MTRQKYTLNLLIFSILALALSSCQLVPAATLSPMPTSGTYHQVLTDNFSDPNSGWTRQRDANFIADYDNGGYRIHIINKTQSSLWGINNHPINGSVTVEVDATFIDGSSKNDMGIICRFQNPENYYYLSITPKGAFGISKVINGIETLIGMADMPQIDDVILGKGLVNHLRVECTDRILVLNVNNVELERIEDTELKSGSIGLIVGTYSDAAIDVQFDNFSVSEP